MIGLHNSNALRSVAAGALEAAAVAMRTHPTVEQIQEYGCGIFSGLTFSETTRAQAVAASGLEAVVAAMVAFPNNAPLLERGCAAMYSFNAVQIDNRCGKRAREVYFLRAICRPALRPCRVVSCPWPVRTTA